MPHSRKSTNSPATPNKAASKQECSELLQKIDLQAEEIRRLQEFVDAQSKHILLIEENFAALKQRVATNEATIERDHSLACLKDHVITELREQLNKTRQFMRRPCAIISGLPKPKDESRDGLKKEIQALISRTNGKITEADVDKFHRDGPQDGSKQDVIIRFKTHTAKEVFYSSRKEITSTNESVKIRPSLTDMTKDLLHEAKDAIDNFKTLVNPPEFVLPDVHGQLMVKMKRRSRVGLFVHFRNMETFVQKIQCAQQYEADNSFEEDASRFDD